jgi:hypothetical protein
MRFYFHFRDQGKLSIDDVGMDYTSLEAAYLDAFAAARDMWHERLVEQHDPRDCAFEITDAAGRVLMTLPFAEVLEACHRGGADRPPHKRAGLVTALESFERHQRLREEMGVQLQLVRASLQKTRELIGGARRSE